MSDEGLHGVDPFSELKRSYKDYKVFDAHFTNMGRVHDIFVDDLDTVRYIGIGSGLLNMDFIPIPVELVRLNDRRQVVEVDATKSQMMHAPTFSDPSELTVETEDDVRRHFGVTPILPVEETLPEGRVPTDGSRVDLIPGERDVTPPPPPLIPDRRELPRRSDRASEIGLRRFTR